MILYDASVFINHARDQKLDCSAHILDLTYYEVGNALWKQVTKLKILDSAGAAATIELLKNWENVLQLRASDLQGIFGSATELNISFYDATYVFYAKKHGFELHTCDKVLYEKAKNVVKTEFVRC